MLKKKVSMLYMILKPVNGREMTVLMIVMDMDIITVNIMRSGLALINSI